MHRTLALALAATGVAAQGAEHLVGRPYAGLPSGWAETASGLLGDLDGDGQTYGLSEHQSVSSASRLYVYSRVHEMHQARYPVWTVLAALVVDDVGEHETATAFGCVLGSGGDESRVVVVVGRPVLLEDEGVFRYGPVRLAWHLDRRAAGFVPAEPSLVECPDEEFVD